MFDRTLFALMFGGAVGLLSLSIEPRAAEARSGGQPAASVFNMNYNAPAAGTLNARPNAIVIAHGWNSGPQFWLDHPTRPANQQTTLRDAIVAQLGAQANQWDIWVMDWSADSTNGGAAPTRATEVRAEKQGHFAARTLLGQNSYQHVHMIGHSLGGRVIESAATMLTQRANAPVVHTTFLDGYTPYFWDRIYGSTSNWSEHLYNRDAAANTQADFPHAMNVDVTNVRDDDGERPTSANPITDAALAVEWRHGWPRRMYVRSARDAANNPPPFSGYGYPHSKEAAGGNWPVPNRNTATRHVLNAVGAPTITNIDRVIVTNPAALNLSADGALKNSANAAITNDMLCLTATGVPAWARLNFTTTAPLNFLQFEFMFDSQNDMTLTAYIQSQGGADQVLYQAIDADRLGGFESTGRISVPFSFAGFASELPAGMHTLAFRLDSSQDDSNVWIRNIRGGRIAVPAPGSIVVMLVALPVAIRRRRVVGCEIAGRVSA